MLVHRFAKDGTVAEDVIARRKQVRRKGSAGARLKALAVIAVVLWFVLPGQAQKRPCQIPPGSENSRILPQTSAGTIRYQQPVGGNPGNGNEWINIKLVGVKSNRSAIGARIKVTVSNQGHAARSFYRTVGSGGSFGASPLEQHIGLGKSARIENVEVWWPATKITQRFNDVSKNQFLEIKEFAKIFTKLERKSFILMNHSLHTAIVDRRAHSRKS